ncbi:hypothetical protein [Erwinia persicina]|uniref:hypothetical protein n=1 Tax=Erwinia persicina TaxID=55211 RepID=UPI00178641DA|nr:hypothetical protein [Erwinia persicina]
MTELKAPYWNRMVPELTVMDFCVSLHFYVDVLGFNIMIRRHEPDFAYVSRKRHIQTVLTLMQM